MDYLMGWPELSVNGAVISVYVLIGIRLIVLAWEGRKG